MGEAALAQVSDEDFFRTLDAENNSVAILVKHLAGNMRSRWRDFLTTDGEKPDRHRDTEFVILEADSRAVLTARWDAAWTLLYDTLDELSPRDLQRTVYIRGEAQTAHQALLRSVRHYAYHVGQLILLARHWAGDRWTTLSIPRGPSEKQ